MEACSELGGVKWVDMIIGMTESRIVGKKREKMSHLLKMEPKLWQKWYLSVRECQREFFSLMESISVT